MWFGCRSDVVWMRVGGGSDVFSDLVHADWQKLREGGFQHLCFGLFVFRLPLKGSEKMREAASQ